MKALATLTLLVLAGCSTVGDRPAVTTVMVYNIHAGKDAAGGSNLEKVAALIAETKADIVLLQEIDRRTTRSSGVDHFEELQRLTGFHGAFGKSLDFQGGEYGIATLSRFPITSKSVVALDVDPPQTRAGGSKEPRVALLVTAAFPAGPISIMNTHLDASKEDFWRLQEIAQLTRVAMESDRPRLLVGGDLNATPDSEVHKRMRAVGLSDSWTDCGTGDEKTYPASGPVKRIDYLYRDSSWKCVEASVLTSDASDHRAVIFKLIAK